MPEWRVLQLLKMQKGNIGWTIPVEYPGLLHPVQARRCWTRCVCPSPLCPSGQDQALCCSFSCSIASA
eukprot:scaffold148_cov341-Pavlova_lutheri.AAC.13